jgi:MFS family permease
MSKPDPTPDGLPRPIFAILFGVGLTTAIGNTGLISVLPSIGREIGIPDPMISAVFALSALLWGATSPLWARASDRFGRKPMIVLGMSGFLVSVTLSGFIVSAGLHHLAPPMVILGLLMVARAIFGGFGSASNPASQAFVAEHTPPAKRTQAISSMAGAFGLGTVIGPFLAPLFILPVVGLAGPLYGFALLAAVMLVLIIKVLPSDKAVGPVQQDEEIPTPVDENGKRRPIWRDPRVSPFLIYGFLTAVSQTVLTQILAFLIMDKLDLSPAKAQGFIAIAMMFGAVAGLLAQWGLIRMFDMTPRQLLRWGVAIAAAGTLVVAVAPDYWAVVVGFAVASLGFGFARPGFTAGASLAVNMGEQARVAGAIAAVNGVNIVFAPAFVWLYQHNASAPFLLTAAMLAGLFVYALRNPQLRNAAPQPTTRDQTVLATLERRDEGL